MLIQNIRILKYHSNKSLFRRSIPSLQISNCLSLDNLPQRPCGCPEILFCDDELYQHFVIKKLIQIETGTPRASSSHSLANHDNHKILCLQSGEQLLERFLELKKNCCCQGPKIIISDYHMGEGLLNGIQVILKLKEYGFNGISILRTSTRIESMTEEDFQVRELVNEKKINHILDKNNLKHQREIIRMCLLKA